MDLYGYDNQSRPLLIDVSVAMRAMFRPHALRLEKTDVSLANIADPLPFFTPLIHGAFPALVAQRLVFVGASRLRLLLLVSIFAA